MPLPCFLFLDYFLCTLYETEVGTIEEEESNEEEGEELYGSKFASEDESHDSSPDEN